MATTSIPFGDETLSLDLPPETEVLRMGSVEPLTDPQAAIAGALDEPIGSPPLDEILREKVAAASAGPRAGTGAAGAGPTATIV
ncbi:MAG: lactate racemase domain-containing protein, partial [Spirochaetota bacterium]